MSILLALAADADFDAPCAHLQASGFTVLGRAACHTLVRDAVRLAPEVVVLSVPVLTDEWRQSLALLADAHPLPVAWFGGRSLPAELEGLSGLGLGGWWPDWPDASSMGDALRWSVSVHRRLRELSGGLSQAQATLDERKWVDRAKGVLMGHQHLSEGDAFRLLRTASMHANLRLGELSRGVVAAARAADAINRAGQLRMLSQWLVRCMAQWHAGVESHAARGAAQDLIARLEDNLQNVAQLLDDAGDDRFMAARGHLQSVRAQWQQMQQQCPPSRLAPSRPEPAAPDAAALEAIDASAEQLLQASDALTQALEQGASRPQLQIVNHSGRQRMRVQRLGKQALLAALLPVQPGRDRRSEAAQTAQDFEAALAELERAPLTTSDIRSELAQARGEWVRLTQDVRSAFEASPPHAVLRRIAHQCDALMARFDRLTTLYEHSMQLLLG